MVMVSKCLLGENCKYSGGHNYRSEIFQLSEEILSFCPECSGGLKTPRQPAEIEEGFDGFDVIDGKAKVYNKINEDVTAEFLSGAKKALEVAKANGITKAYFKQSSPSCGNLKIYDGTFSGNKKSGAGVTAALFIKNGIEVIGIE